jgi:hypothetical protein
MCIVICQKISACTISSFSRTNMQQSLALLIANLLYLQFFCFYKEYVDAFRIMIPTLLRTALTRPKPVLLLLASLS